MIVKNEYPILEYSTEYDAVINPQLSAVSFPRLCLVTFFQEVLENIVSHYSGTVIGTYQSEMKGFDVYRIVYCGTELCLIQAVVASGSIAMMTDWLYGKGVETILCCGSCGVLADIPAGDVILPVRALRDEGASYKYLPPARFIDLSPEPVAALRSVLEQRHIPYVTCTTWSTDGFYRETKEMVQHRIEDGCKVVEMECATMAAIAVFRGKTFGQVLYSGDILVGSDEYDDRGWRNNQSAREKLVYIALDALCLL